MTTNTVEAHTSHIVICEIYNVLTVMRQNSKWDTRAKMVSSSLIKNLEQLREQLEMMPSTDINTVDTFTYLHPFLEVIKSDQTNGPITAIALAAVHKFVSRGFIGLQSINPSKGIQHLIMAVTHCRFEATDSQSDEIVLLKILHVLHAAVLSPVGHLLTNKLIYDTVQTCYKMNVQKRLSLLLRKTAENILIEMIECIFSRPLKDTTLLPSETTVAEDSSESIINDITDNIISASPSLSTISGFIITKQTTNDNDGIDSNGNSINCNGNHSTAGSLEIIDELELSASVELKASVSDANGKVDTTTSGVKKFVNPKGITFERWATDEETPCDNRILIKLLKFFIQLVSSTELPSRLLGLTLINTVVESHGLTNPRVPSNNLSKVEVAEFLCNDVFRSMMQILQKIKKDDKWILNCVLRISYNLIMSYRSQLHFQISVFLRFLLQLLQGDEQIPVDFKEHICEVLVQLFRDPSFPLDLFVNFDCDLEMINIFENLILFFTNNCVYSRDDKPDNRSSTSPSIQKDASYLCSLSMDAFVALLQSINNRTKLKTKTNTPSITEILEKKEKKAIALKAATLFAENPNDAFEYLAKNSVSSTAPPPAKHADTNGASGVDEGNGAASGSNSQVPPMDAKAVALFLRSNPFLSKTKVGEYLGQRKDFNEQVLTEYCRTFDFVGKPYLIALREYFSSFRPLGESQIIERYIDGFCYHFLASNGNILVDDVSVSIDPIYTLTYSIIMLNVDRHSPYLENRNRMTQNQYTSNLRGLNNKQDFPFKFLTSIYDSVCTDEIKIHTEHIMIDLTDNTWKHLYNQAKENKKETFTQTFNQSNSYDPILFDIIASKILGAAKYVFNTTKSEEIMSKTLFCFQQLALIAAHYNHTSSMDLLITTLSDLSTMLSLPMDKFITTYTKNNRNPISTIALFTIAQKHNKYLRESWKEVIMCLVRLWLLGLLPPKDDLFPLLKDKFTFPEENTKPPEQVKATSLGKLAYEFIAGTVWWVSNQDEVTENEVTKLLPEIKNIIKSCNIPLLFQSLSNTGHESLEKWVSTIISSASTSPNAQPFLSNLLTHTVITNKFRVNLIWEQTKSFFTGILTNTLVPFEFLYQTVTNVMTMALYLVPLDQFRSDVLRLIFLPTTLNLKETFSFNKLKKKVSVGLKKVLIKNMKFFSSEEDWNYVIKFIVWVYQYPNTMKDGFECLTNSIQPSSILMDFPDESQSESKTLDPYTVDLNSSKPTKEVPSTYLTAATYQQFFELLKYSITLSSPSSPSSNTPITAAAAATAAAATAASNVNNPTTPRSGKAPSFSCSKCLELIQHMVSLVGNFVEDEGQGMELYWMPTLKYLSTLCRDERVEIHSQAMASLQKILLLSVVNELSSQSIQDMIEQVVFPLLESLLEINSNQTTMNKDQLEEIRLRATSILCKTFLQYLPKLIKGPSFVSVWLKVIDLVRRYMLVDNSELLAEASIEALKNMVIVMHSSGVVRSIKFLHIEDHHGAAAGADAGTGTGTGTGTGAGAADDVGGSGGEPTEIEAKFWELSWEKITPFCPKLRNHFTNIVVQQQQDNSKKNHGQL